jgi:hypothetical protein
MNAASSEEYRRPIPPLIVRASYSRKQIKPLHADSGGCCHCRSRHMKLVTTITRPLQADLQAELRDLERAVAAGTRSAGQGLRTELRRQVASAGLGQRLATSCGTGTTRTRSWTPQAWSAPKRHGSSAPSRVAQTRLISPGPGGLEQLDGIAGESSQRERVRGHGEPDDGAGRVDCGKDGPFVPGSDQR